jgi:DNA-binding transcriptional ArsR family regulator
MVDDKADSLDAVLMALADPTRRAILKQLSRRESTVNEIAKPYGISLAGVSKHIKVLEKARLVIKHKDGKDGRIQHCRLNPQPLGAVAKLLIEYKQFWESQFDALEKYLHETLPTRSPPK